MLGRERAQPAGECGVDADRHRSPRQVGRAGAGRSVGSATGCAVPIRARQNAASASPKAGAGRRWAVGRRGRRGAAARHPAGALGEPAQQQPQGPAVQHDVVGGESEHPPRGPEPHQQHPHERPGGQVEGLGREPGEEVTRALRTAGLVLRPGQVHHRGPVAVAGRPDLRRGQAVGSRREHRAQRGGGGDQPREALLEHIGVQRPGDVQSAHDVIGAARSHLVQQPHPLLRGGQPRGPPAAGSRGSLLRGPPGSCRSHCGETDGFLRPPLPEAGGLLLIALRRPTGSCGSRCRRPADSC